MTHPSFSDLRAHIDRALPDNEQAHIDAHLQSCPACTALRAELDADSRWVQERLNRLDHSPAIPAGLARARLQARLADPNKETSPMNINLRKALVPALLAGLLLVLFAVPSVRAAAIDFLGLFRVQQIEVVPFNPANLPQSIADGNVQFDRLLQDQIVFSDRGEAVEVAGVEEASAMAGFEVRLPAGIDSYKMTYQPAASASIVVDVALWQGLLNDLGRTDLVLPEQLDGESITVHIPNSVTIGAGDCTVADSPDGDYIPVNQVDCLVLIQMPSPTIEAPAGLPVDEMGRILLQFLGMSPSEVEGYSERIDWTTTLILPVPNFADYRDVQVGDADGVLFITHFDSGTSSLNLIWVDGETLSALILNGDYSAVDAIRIAEGLE